MGMRGLFAVLAAVLIAGAGRGTARTLLILPVQGEVEKTSDLAAVNDLFREAVQNVYQGRVESPRDSAHQCGDRDCAAALVKAAGADEVMFSSLRRLGGKWIFSATLLRAADGGMFNQRGTALNLEDLEAVTRRVGEAVVARRTLEQVASIDNITEKEEAKEPARRRSLYAGGLSLGYLYPLNGSYTSLESPDAFGSEPPEERSYRQMARLSWLNTWEFRENIILGFDATWFIPQAVGGDLNIQYLLQRTDFAPFVGGGVGLHAVFPDDGGSTTKRNSGPALNMQGGMILFRTYDIHVIARAQYHMVFNSDLDNGPGFDVGVVYQRREKEHQSSGWGSFWKYYLLGGLFLTIVGAASD